MTILTKRRLIANVAHSHDIRHHCCAGRQLLSCYQVPKLFGMTCQVNKSLYYFDLQLDTLSSQGSNMAHVPGVGDHCAPRTQRRIYVAANRKNACSVSVHFADTDQVLFSPVNTQHTIQ